jgi:hypothetical protein
MIDLLGLLYDAATDNIVDFLVILLIGGFLVYGVWVGIKTIFSGKDKK